MRAKPALPIDWMALDTDERVEILQNVLGVWVPRMVREFGLNAQVVPPCWYRHPPMIHELLALYQYRQQQQFFEEMPGPASAGLDFQYQFWLWRSRMREWAGASRCNETQHNPHIVQEWADPNHVESATWGVGLDEHCHELLAFPSPTTPLHTIENGALE
ncbi:hypothetical protein [Leucobacter musarum]|uniref:hypothetical protein n=1 Tax=Leucobacter musarum TaxID=1930747 RepID=UPI001EFBDBC6|nr:hypothetical protein [Leucobacter musarum]